MRNLYHQPTRVRCLNYRLYSNQSCQGNNMRRIVKGTFLIVPIICISFGIYLFYRFINVGQLHNDIHSPLLLIALLFILISALNIISMFILPTKSNLTKLKKRVYKIIYNSTLLILILAIIGIMFSGFLYFMLMHSD